MVCPRNKPIKNWESLQSPPLAISWQNHHSHWFLTTIIETTGQQWFYITKRYLKTKSWSLQSLVEQSIPENKVSIFSNTHKCEMNHVRYNKHLHSKILSTTSCNVCECNAPPQRVTPPQRVISPKCTIATTICILPLPSYSPFLSWYRQRSSPQHGH